MVTHGQILRNKAKMFFGKQPEGDMKGLRRLFPSCQLKCFGFIASCRELTGDGLFFIVQVLLGYQVQPLEDETGLESLNIR